MCFIRILLCILRLWWWRCWFLYGGFERDCDALWVFIYVSGRDQFVANRLLLVWFVVHLCFCGCVFAFPRASASRWCYAPHLLKVDSHWHNETEGKDVFLFVYSIYFLNSLGNKFTSNSATHSNDFHVYMMIHTPHTQKVNILKKGARVGKGEWEWETNFVNFLRCEITR